MAPTRPIALAAALGLGASALAVVGSGPLSATIAPANAATPRPNFVMITADDASTVDLRYMPHTRALIAQKGVTLSNAIAPTPICVPARASLLTGQYADNHHARTISGPYGGFNSFDARNTLPVWLKDSGYSTMFTGKYLNGYESRANRGVVPPGWSNWQAATANTYGFFDTWFNANGRQQRSRGYSTDAITTRATNMLTWQHRAPNKPFFLWVNYVGPHHGGPRAADDPRGMENTTPAPTDVNRFSRTAIPASADLWEKDTRGNKFALAPKSAAYKRGMREVFQQRVEALQSVDRGVARIINRLYVNGDLGNTYVIFSSDNGYLTGHHNRQGKLVPYDKSLRIPMVIRGPGMPTNTVARTTVTNPDIAVSIAAKAGVRPGRAVDGVPVLDRLRSGTGTRPVPITGWAVTDGRRLIYRGIRYGGYTYFVSGRQIELYDRGRDPGELINYINYKAYADEAKMLRGLYNRYATCRASTCPKTWS